MPLDGHDFLVAQGWSGNGTGLREGAISRPLAIPQKKNLAGVGKDRDEAFPFWDHLFTAAAKSIQLKFASDDESDEDLASTEIKRTTTGILSNRRPVTGVSVNTSGTSTPDASDIIPRLNLLSVAKRNAARSNLYSRFFRGPILGPDDNPYTPTSPPSDDVDEKRRDKISRDEEMVESSAKKRKRDSEDDSARRQRKEERKEHKDREKEERRARRRERRAAREEKATEKHKKKKKRVGEVEKAKNQENDTVAKEEKKKRKGKEKKSKAKESTPTRDDLKGGEYNLVGELVPTLDPASTYSTSMYDERTDERHERKKKRKREDV
ncbi:hypothetical protein H0H87_008712 [Tephrocybe sp. NHM501043]|nr:hypothetical protein H0H87_008712 [Tephrocybe sp. NHM501043]